jgi:hypothetical protein
MKIGILTLHSSLNHGAYLQAYSLFKLLEKNYYHDVYIINHKSKERTTKEIRILFQRNPFSTIKNIFKFITFKRFHQNFNLTKFSNNIESINIDGFDVIILGSDEIWNFSKSIFKYNKAYYGFGINCSKIISYAPSCSESEYEDLPADLEGFTGNISHISVRDKSTYKLIKRIDVQKKCHIVLDPTFLYDFRNEMPPELKVKDYILVYGNINDQLLINDIIDFAKEKELNIVSIGYKNKWANINKINISPFLWLRYIYQAKYVITNTFHGCVFSIKFNKQFIACLDQNKKSKIESLLYDFNLINRLYIKPTIAKQFESSINYDSSFNALLQNKINQSLEFLKNSINE